MLGFATIGGTASAGEDFRATSGQLQIPAGETTATIPVTILGDHRVEPDERFSVVLDAPVGATLADPDATVTIRNDDRPCANAIERIFDRVWALLTGGWFRCQ
jgi:hypothetical protein